jgi:hypothetical protein
VSTGLKQLKFFLFLQFVLSPLIAVRSEFLELGNLNYDYTKSHWKFGVELEQFYFVSKTAFNGEFLDIESNEEFLVPGTGITLGRHFYWWGGLGSTINLSLMHHKQEEVEIGKVSKDIKEKLIQSYVEIISNQGQVTFDLSYTFDTKYFVVRPYAGVGQGKGTYFQNYDYEYDEKLEYFRYNEKQLYDMTTTFGGLQFITNRGIYSEFRYGSYALDIYEIESKSKYKKRSDTARTLLSETKTVSNTFDTYYYHLSMGVFF